MRRFGAAVLVLARHQTAVDDDAAREHVAKPGLALEQGSSGPQVTLRVHRREGDAELREGAIRYTGAGVGEVAKRIRAQLGIPKTLADRRFDLMHRMAALALAQRALSGGAFDGADAELFFETLLDAMAAILEGPVSRATERELSRQSR